MADETVLPESRDNEPTSRRTVLQRWLGIGAGLALGGVYTASVRNSRRSRRKVVRFWHLLGGDWQAPLERVVARFNESQSTYEVMPLLIPGDSADSKFLLAVSGGDPPDVMLHWTQAINTWASAGLLYPLSDLLTPAEKQWMAQKAFPVIQKSGWHDGKLYALVMGFDLWVCYYRPDHFREAGLDPDRFPTTLEELVAVGKTLDRYDTSGNLTRIGFLPEKLHYYVPSFGGWFYDDRARQLTLDAPPVVNALRFLVGQRQRLGFDKTLRFASSLSGTDWPFVTNAYSIVLDGEWQVERLRRLAPHIEYRTVPIPPPAGGRPNASYSGLNFLTIPQGAKERDGAWEFLRFWTGLSGPERAAEFYPWLGWMPMGQVQVETPIYQKYLAQVPQYQTFLDVATSENVEIIPPVPYQLYLMDRIARADDLATRGTLTPEAALAGLKADIAHEQQRRKALGYHD